LNKCALTLKNQSHFFESFIAKQVFLKTGLKGKYFITTKNVLGILVILKG